MDLARRLLSSRWFFWVVLYAPAALMIKGFLQEQLFYGEMLHITGETSARLLMITLAITPCRLMFPTAGWPQWLLRRRRYFGVAACGYALLHTLVYLDKRSSLALIVEDGLAFEMWTGWLALAIFLLLALTSNNVSVRLLRRTWQKLHRWVYIAAVLAFAHWIFIAFDFIPGLIHLLLILCLEAYRIFKTRPGFLAVF
ncbi:MAG: ferric reductase-like transmembrane domain-containing protein [Gammaproteobacteria bacterium]|nr:ferric reductase-like transmembrane domain-containing protein [Gammaproteobacteria bacterium]